jgi:hypothetical protein
MDDRRGSVAGLERVSTSAAVDPRDTLSGWRAATAGSHLPMLAGVLRVRPL